MGTSFADVNEAQRLASDIDGNGNVGLSDVKILSGQWLSEPGAAGPWADLAKNGDVNLVDYAMFARDYGKSAAAGYKGNYADNSYDPGGVVLGQEYFWRVDEVDKDNTYRGEVWSFTVAQLAFSGAEGFGRYAAGGRGGTVIHVTNLNDSGEGSLRAAVSALGARTIVFDVGGTINTSSDIVCGNSYCTIDGYSAPSPGISIYGNGLAVIKNDITPCHDVIIRNIRVGFDETGDDGGNSLEIAYSSHDVMVDHCSIRWGTDECADTWGFVTDVTFQWSVIAEGRLYGQHSEGSHSMGMLSGGASERISIHHCLFAHNAARNPLLYGRPAYSLNSVYDVVNNIIYNWGTTGSSTISEGGWANLVGNLYLPGPQSSSWHGGIFVTNPENDTKIYIEANGGDGGLPDVNEWSMVTWFEYIPPDEWTKHQPAPQGVFRALVPFETPPIRRTYWDEPNDLMDVMLPQVGAFPRDADDTRIINEVITRTGSLGYRDKFVTGP